MQNVANLVTVSMWL